MGLTVSRETSKKLTVRRENAKNITVSRESFFTVLSVIFISAKRKGKYSRFLQKINTTLLGTSQHTHCQLQV